jgi:hypothetical protein
MKLKRIKEVNPPPRQTEKDKNKEGFEEKEELYLFCSTQRRKKDNQIEERNTKGKKEEKGV